MTDLSALAEKVEGRGASDKAVSVFYGKVTTGTPPVYVRWPTAPILLRAKGASNGNA